jgi:hypothetical protein
MPAPDPSCRPACHDPGHRHRRLAGEAAGDQRDLAPEMSVRQTLDPRLCWWPRCTSWPRAGPMRRSRSGTRAWSGCTGRTRSRGTWAGMGWVQLRGGLRSACADHQRCGDASAGQLCRRADAVPGPGDGVGLGLECGPGHCRPRSGPLPLPGWRAAGPRPRPARSAPAGQESLAVRARLS